MGKNFLTIRQLAEKHRAFSESSIRWMVFTSPSGFVPCVRRVGRKVLIEENAFLDYIDQQKAA